MSMANLLGVYGAFRPLNERASSGEISAIRIRILWSIAGSTQISNSLI